VFFGAGTDGTGPSSDYVEVFDVETTEVWNQTGWALDTAAVDIRAAAWTPLGTNNNDGAFAVFAGGYSDTPYPVTGAGATAIVCQDGACVPLDCPRISTGSTGTTTGSPAGTTGSGIGSTTGTVNSTVGTTTASTTSTTTASTTRFVSSGDPGVEASTPVESSDGETGLLLPLILAGAGACCVILLVLFAVVLLKRRGQNSLGSSGSVEMEMGADDVDPEGDYHSLSAVHALADTPAKLRPAQEVADEDGNYAELPGDFRSLEGNYAKVDAVTEAGSNALSDEVAVLSAQSIMVDTTRKIGRGNFGDVFLGEYNGQVVAVKMLRRGFSPQQLRSFYDEAEVIARIPEHEHLVGFLGVTPSPFMILTEFCQSGSLKSYLRQLTTSLSIEQELKVVRDVANGMAFLAANGVVHRDLAARNVLLTEDLSPRIADFGLSRQIEAGSTEHHSKTASGPARWMSVESIRKGLFSEKSDVWSFAVCAWECHNRAEVPYGKETATIQVVREILAGRRLQYGDAIPDRARDLYER
jgi:predicted Ser/Thr protein kinase